MARRDLRIHSPRLCENCRHRTANSVLILNHELMRGRTVRLRVCDRCAVKLSAEDAELARKAGHQTDPHYEVRNQ